MKTIRSKLTYANVMATIAVFIAIGGSAYAATQLKKNSVGTKQIKNQAVTAAKIKNGAITGAQVKNGSLTGTQINASTLGSVPSATTATHAVNAGSSTSATHADSATTAATAEAITPPEAMNLVGEPGEPSFGPGWENFRACSETPVGFYKDREGVVHLQGIAQNGGSTLIFALPTGYAPKAPEVFPAFGNGGTLSLSCECRAKRSGRNPRNKSDPAGRHHLAGGAVKQNVIAPNACWVASRLSGPNSPSWVLERKCGSPLRTLGWPIRFSPR